MARRGMKFYQWSDGDTLTDIAKRFGTTPAQLAALNPGTYAKGSVLAVPWGNRGSLRDAEEEERLLEQEPDAPSGEVANGRRIAGDVIPFPELRDPRRLKPFGGVGGPRPARGGEVVPIDKGRYDPRARKGPTPDREPPSQFPSQFIEQERELFRKDPTGWLHDTYETLKGMKPGAERDRVERLFKHFMDTLPYEGSEAEPEPFGAGLAKMFG